MKRLYTFKMPIKKTVEVQVEKEIEGKKVTVVEKVEEEEQKAYFIKRPNRSEYEEAELFHDINFGNDVRKGVLTRSEIVKRFANEDVVIKKVYEDYTAKENEFQRLLLREKTEETEKQRKKLEQEILNILIDIQNFELTKSSVFEHTAENRARNKVIFWWILNLAYKVEGDKEIPIFEGETFQDKQKSYERIFESEDKHLNGVIQRFFYFIPAWYTGNVSKEEDFKKAEDMLISELSKVETEKSEVKNVVKSVEPEDTVSDIT